MKTLYTTWNGHRPPLQTPVGRLQTLPPRRIPMCVQHDAHVSSWRWEQRIIATRAATEALKKEHGL